jgi:membrane dipeptidase
MWGAVLGSTGAMLASDVTAAQAQAPRADAEPLAAATKLLRDNVSVDVHTHGGPDGITSQAKTGPTDEIPRGMRTGRIALLCLADVPDAPILGRNAQGVAIATRVPEPGLLWKYHLGRLDWVDELVAKQGVRRALTSADINAAHGSGQPAIVVDVEGLDFLEKKLERLEETYQRGVRTMQLVHYTPTDLGDFQTGAVVHNGLTPFGADVIRACDKLGVVVDVAHATADTVKQAAKVATRPLLLSHTALRGSKAQGQTPLTERQITPDHARAVADTGGSIGIWHFFATFDLYVAGIKEMVDVVGVDHVSIGTDTSRGTGLFPRYDQFPELVAAMLRGGFSPADTAKIIGGNFMRIFAASVG